MWDFNTGLGNKSAFVKVSGRSWFQLYINSK